MFSKLSTFRSKGPRYQKAKHNQYGHVDSRLSTDEENYTPKTDLSDSTSKSSSSFTNTSSTEVGHSPFGFRRSDLSRSQVSETAPTLRSLLQHSPYDDSSESQTTSSAPAEDIDIGNAELLPYEEAEEQFLEGYEAYFEHLSVDNVRKEQYPKLDVQRLVYLDYATRPLYSHFQVQQHMRILLEEAGPHLAAVSTLKNPTSPLNMYINSTCERLLNLFNTTQYDFTIIFTSGVASCYHLFSEMYQFHKGSVLLVNEDNHESVRHVVRAAVQSGVKTGAVPVRSNCCIHGSEMRKLLKRHEGSNTGSGLLIYPAQSCLSGVRHSLNWIVDAQQNGWKVLLDVSSSLPMLMIDLSLYQPEFVVGSFHHMLGYPSNVGFLLVRRNSHSICTQKGSNQLKVVGLPEHGRAVHITREADSLSLHTFAALCFGLEHLEAIGFLAIRKRVESLTAWLAQTLNSLKHKLDEKPLLQIYGSPDRKYRGSILVFNVLDSTGNVFPSGLVQRLAERSNIFVGSCSLKSPDLALLLLQKLGRQAGSTVLSASTSNLTAVHISLGPVSIFEDVYRLVQFLSRFRDEDYTSSEAVGYMEEQRDDC